MPTVELGLLFLGSRPPERFVEVARLAERAGFDYFWVPDERFFREIYSLCTVVAGATDRIRIGPCVTDPYSRHPALTAMAIATLDEISGGRAMLGIGAGVSGFAELGLERPKPAQAVREAIELIRKLLSEGSASYQGEVVQFDGSLNFEPRRQSILVYLAAAGPLMLSLAGEMADGVILEACMNQGYYDKLLAHIQNGLRHAGRPLADIAIVPRIDVAVAESREQAYAALRPRLAKKLIGAAPGFERFTDLGLEVPVEIRERARGLSYSWDPAILDSLTEGLPDSYMDSFFIAATPDTIGQHLDMLIGRGATQIIINPVPTVADRVEPVIDAVAGHLR